MRSPGAKHITRKETHRFLTSAALDKDAVFSIPNSWKAPRFVLKYWFDPKGFFVCLFCLVAFQVYSGGDSDELFKSNNSAADIKKYTCKFDMCGTENPEDPDIVYFDRECLETNRVVDSNVHQTWVMSTGYVRECFDGVHEYVAIDMYVRVPMPGRIYRAESWDKHDYNQYDHLIAVETFRFNQKKNNRELLPLSKHTENPEGVTDLDPNVVKSIMLKETRAGKLRGGFRNGKVDVMQINVTGDWSPHKARLGLKRGRSVSSAQQSIHASILYLYWKGIRIRKIKNTHGKTVGYKSEWIGGLKWKEAIKNYNGNGDRGYMTKLEDHYKGLLRGVTDNVYKKSMNAAFDSGNGTGAAMYDAKGRLKARGVFAMDNLP